MLDFTTVIAVDDRHVRELEITWPTWVRFRPEILHRPLLILCDGDRSHEEWHTRLAFVEHPDRRLVCWQLAGVDQREKMLTALTLAPGREVSSDWYLKLDTDAIAVATAPWIQPEWFAPDASGRLPVFVGSSWGYTKPAQFLARMDMWADGRPEFTGTTPLNLQAEPDSNRVRHPRITSWCFFGRTDWTRDVTSVCNGRLPVPSHDTFLWYCAERMGMHYRRIPMHRLGWVHTSRMRKLARLARRSAALPRSSKADQDNSSPIPSEAAVNRVQVATPKQLPSSSAPVSAGIVYLLTGPGHAARLVVSIASLRNHYAGPVTLVTTEDDSHGIGERIAADERLQVAHQRGRRTFRRKNAAYLTKLQLLQAPPFDRTLYLDADTLVVGDISDLFAFGDTAQIVATQFSDWTSDRRPVKQRIEAWRQLSVDRFLGFTWTTLLDTALQKHPAVNGGVFAVRRDAELLSHWFELAQLGKRKFICDEIALQILLHHFPHRLLDCRWNCSPIYGRGCNDVRIWHMHGDKHLRPEAKPIWWPRFELARAQNLGRLKEWEPAGDRRLADHVDRRSVEAASV